MSDVYPPRVPESSKGVTDFDALAVGIMLSTLADRHTDSEILAMLKPKKVRAALKLMRAAAKAQEG